MNRKKSEDQRENDVVARRQDVYNEYMDRQRKLKGELTQINANAIRRQIDSANKKRQDSFGALKQPPRDLIKR